MADKLQSPHVVFSWTEEDGINYTLSISTRSDTAILLVDGDPFESNLTRSQIRTLLRLWPVKESQSKTLNISVSTSPEQETC